jgi:hypothetical protein
MVEMTSTTGTVQLMTDQPHHLIHDTKPTQFMGRDTTCPENATRCENQHPIEAIIQPPAGQPTPMRIAMPEKTDLHIRPRIPNHLHLDQDDLLMPPPTTKVARIGPEELGDKTRTPTNLHPHSVNVPQISEPTDVAV